MRFTPAFVCSRSSWRSFRLRDHRRAAATPFARAPGLTAADYYPLADGWKWAFDVEQDGTNILATYVVLERKEAIAVVQAGDERLTYVVTPDGVAQFDGGAIGDYVIKNPIKQGAEWAVAGGRARIASTNEEVNIEAVGRLRRLRGRRGDARRARARDAHGVRPGSGSRRPGDAGARGPEVRDQGAGPPARGHETRGPAGHALKTGPRSLLSPRTPLVGMFGPDEGEPQTGDGGSGRGALGL